MLSSNPQDEAMLSERNEQEMFQSESSSGDGNQSFEEINQNSDDEHQLDQNKPAFQLQPSVPQLETKKVKESCLEKLKGYIGFGSLLTSQRIGNVFLIPISNKWTFKTQVIITQLIITSVSLAVFFGIKFIGQSIFKDIIQEWSKENFGNLQFQQINDISSAYLDLLEITKSNELKFANITNDLLQQTDLIWDVNQLIQMNEPLIQTDPNQDIYPAQIAAITLNQSTYAYLNSTIQNSNEELQFIMGINYVLKYNYITLGSQYFWILNNGLMIQYPGINVTNLTSFLNYRRNIDYQNIVSNDFMYDDYLKIYLQRQSYPIYDRNDKTTIIGKVFIERQSSIYLNLLNVFASSDYLNYSIILVNKQNTIINDYPDYLKESILELLLHQNKSKIVKFETLRISRQFELYKTNINEKIHSFSLIQQNFTTILVYPYTLLEQQLKEQDLSFDNYTVEFSQRYLAACIVVPILYIIGVVFFLSRELQPLIKITRLAYMSLKKSQTFDENQLNDIKGDGLISKLTLLFMQLMKKLNEEKQKKQKEIIEYYNQQTYPCNHNVKDVEPILREIEQIKYMGRINGKIKIPNLEE